LAFTCVPHSTDAGVSDGGFRVRPAREAKPERDIDTAKNRDIDRKSQRDRDRDRDKDRDEVGDIDTDRDRYRDRDRDRECVD